VKRNGRPLGSGRSCFSCRLAKEQHRSEVHKTLKTSQKQATPSGKDSASKKAGTELARILEQEIARYYDDDLKQRISDTAAEIHAELDAANTEIYKRHAKAIAALEAERKKVLGAITTFEKKARPVLNKIKKELEAHAPDVDDFDWPEPDEGDEDDDPLFDSTREYLDQIDRYKAHQGKATEAAPRKKPRRITATCIVCAREFLTTLKTAKTCSETCRHKLNYKPRSRTESLESAHFHAAIGVPTCGSRTVSASRAATGRV
jgi:hypothetical protein